MNYGEFAYKFFHYFSKKYSYLFKDLKEDLMESNITYTIEEYFASMIMTVVLSLPLIVVMLFGFFFLLGDFLLAIISSLIFYSLIAIGIVVLFYIWPSQQAGNRRKKIDNALHFAAIYMQTLSGTGAPPHLLFRILGSFQEFSEISEMSRKISRDIEIFGMDPSEAISKAAEKTPSPNLREMLWGMKATITSGGDLRIYLSEKAKSFINEYKRKLEAFTQIVAVLLEIYITIVIVGSVLALILTTIMGLIGGGVTGLPELQILLVTVGLPLMSVIFIVLIKASSPTEV
ncbi:MAG TPA: type II secretion system F family protein [Candidatus Nanoarchaeia archaeon]|nr:type II secretion system F family protein [Candidatus Nanoarchaeia archaeon]